MALTKDQTVTLISAAVLMPRACQVLSDFEIELVADVGYRFLRHGREASVTDNEWTVLQSAVEAMRIEMHRRVGAVRAVAA